MSLEDNQKIKVAIVINDFLVGGAQRLVADQLKYLDRERFEYVLITLFTFPGKSNFHHLIPDDVQLHQLSFSSFKDVKNWINLFQLLREIRPNIVISHLFFSNTVTRILKVLCGYTCIAVVHNTYIDKTHLQIFVDKILSYATYKIVAVSKTVALFTSRQERIPRTKFEIIHNGIDIKEINSRIVKLSSKDVLKEELGFRKNDKLFINVARLTPQKNQLLLIESFAHFVSKYPESHLVILGEGGLRRKLEGMINKYSLHQKISLCGYVDPIPYYKVSDYFILTSHIEGFAIVGIEAMTCGLPVVSTKTAGPDEYIQEGKNGFFIEPASTKEVVKSMERVALFPDYDFLRKNAVNSAQEFDIRNTVAKYSTLLSSAACQQ